jgi:hypothetical protein
MTRHPRRTGVAALALALTLALSATASGVGSDPVPAAGASPRAAAATARADAGRGPRIDRAAFHDDMRKLWEDHVTWTRLFLVSAITGLPDGATLPDLDATTGRLLQNQTDIGNAIAPFYGADAGAALTALLREHILTAAEIVNAAKAGDQAAVADASARWYANADAIARFLADANPHFKFRTISDLMRSHLDQTLAEATARLTGDWAGDVAAYEVIHLHILHMADFLSDGIVKQFPDRFKKA